MLDMKLVRQNPEKIRKMLKDRMVEFDLDLLLQLDEKRRELIISTDSLRNKKNKMSINTGYFSRMSKAVTKKVNRTLKRNMINNELDNDALYFIYDEKIWLLVLEEHSESDLIKEIDGFRILAPNFY